MPPAKTVYPVYGGTYAKVWISDGHFRVFNIDGSPKCHTVVSQRVGALAYHKIWYGGLRQRYGSEYFDKDYKGSTLLVKLAPMKYMYIDGLNTLEFATTAPVTHYESHLGNNSIPYSMCFTADQKAYLLTDRKWFAWTPPKNPYTIMYEDKPKAYTIAHIKSHPARSQRAAKRLS
jgi:hypothetical protein